MRAARLLLLLAPLHAQQRRTSNDVVSTRPKYSSNDVVSRKRGTGRPRVGIAYTRNEVTAGPNGASPEHHVFELRNAVLSALSVKRAARRAPQRGVAPSGEIQLPDAMAAMIGTQPFHAFTFEGERHDCGDKASFVNATLALALARDDIAPAVRAFAAERLG